MHSRVASCTHDLAEADEDLWGWVSKMKLGNPGPGMAELEKMHEEFREAMKY
jgi:hypothetical protein